MYRKSTGRRDRLSIGLGTESMPELEPGTNAVLRLCVRRRGRLLGQHLRELVRGIADRIAALSLDNYAAGLAYMAGLARDAGQSAYDLFKDYPQSPA
jgi:hypothetical protein